MPKSSRGPLPGLRRHRFSSQIATAHTDRDGPRSEIIVVSLNTILRIAQLGTVGHSRPRSSGTDTMGMDDAEAREMIVDTFGVPGQRRLFA
jgi:hypothetical protein